MTSLHLLSVNLSQHPPTLNHSHCVLGGVLSHPTDVALGLLQDELAYNGCSQIVWVITHDAHYLILFESFVDGCIADTSDVLKGLLVFANSS